MIDYPHADSFWRFHLKGAGNMKLPLYLKMLEIFVDSGDLVGYGEPLSADRPWQDYPDPMVAYLVRLMSNDEIKVRVLGDRLCGKIFYTTVGRFVVDCVHHCQFLSQRQWTERKRMEETLGWSDERRSEHQAWQSLLAELGRKYEDDGFDADFFERRFGKGEAENYEVWEKMVADWAEAANGQLRRASVQHMEKAGNCMSAQLSKLLDNAKTCVAKNQISSDQALQAWRLMDGRWAETEFERRLQLVKLQDRYPQIEKVVRQMGRVPNADGSSRMATVAGTAHKMEHASGSDIEGVTIGNDLNAMLPSEAALYMDDELEDAFLYKFVRRRLQVFRYKSNLSKPARRLSSVASRRQGPMIVCVDTSASMYGVPQRIAKSMLTALEETAERLHRDCFLIDFSVSVRPMDLMQRRKEQFYTSIGLKKEEYEFKRGELPFIGGGTSARHMMDQMFALLDDGNGKYMNADVLWVSDFLIPFPDTSYLSKIKTYRQTGTRFYGMRIMAEGAHDTEWTPYFDRIFPVTYRQLRRY